MPSFRSSLAKGLLLSRVAGTRAAYTVDQLKNVDIGNFSAIDFGSAAKDPAALAQTSPCKVFPGDPDWPTEYEWNRLNASLNGVLLQPTPLASVCYVGLTYNATRCERLVGGANITREYSDDPLTLMTTWTQGNTCAASLDPVGNCTQGGFPSYVVNATTVKHVQIAVNFARNKNLRLVIKNTGHDFIGRSGGAGALSIWTHYFKSFEFLPLYVQDGGDYTGMAVKVGTGIEGWEQFKYMAENNITLAAPGAVTVGAYGGWTFGGGHGLLTSTYGLGSDQVLSMDVVTADGHYVTASPTANEDLFYALRGGGGGTFGVVTSLIAKAYPPINVTQAVIDFIVNPSPPSSAVVVPDTETFWAGVDLVYRFSVKIGDAGGYGWTYIYPLANSSYELLVHNNMPGLDVDAVAALHRPLIQSLNDIGIPAVLAPPKTGLYGVPQSGDGAKPGNSRFVSRLFPRANWEDDTLFIKTMKAIRTMVEAGYKFHGDFLVANDAVAGHPLPSGIGPAWRTTVMHADIFDPQNMTAPADEVVSGQARMDGYMRAIRDLTPGGGAYMNEMSPLEPNWQESVFGSNYPRLLEIKKARDPWGLFWARQTVGSEDWQVMTPDEVPSQNGRLCRTK